MLQVDRLYSMKDAIVLAGLRPTKAYQEIATGRLRVIKNGRRTFVRASEIERYIATLEAEGGASRTA